MSVAVKNILVVEEKGDWLNILTQVISICGYEVIEASADAESIRNAAASRPDLILLDLQFLGHNADNIFGQLRTDALTKDAPIVVEVTYGDDESIGRAMHTGANKILYKPFDLSDLATVLRDLATGTHA